MKVACVIPAYNEEKTIGNVINAIKKVEFIKKIIVVSDGSTDNTAKEARDCGAIVLELHKNVGKGAALKTGLKCCDEDIILFMDADLIGLNQYHIIKLIEPILKNEAEMTVGIFKSGRFLTDLAQRIAPYLSGQRAVKRALLEDIYDLDINRYEFETVLTEMFIKKSYKITCVKLNDLTHVMKEEKYGFLRGCLERTKMYWQILRGIWMYYIRRMVKC